MKEWTKTFACYLLYGVLSLAPACCVIALDWEVYTATPQRCFSLTIAGGVALCVVVLHALGHTPKHVKRVVWYALASALLWALRPIVQSLALLLTALTAGELAAMMVAQPLITRRKKAKDRGELAKAIEQGLSAGGIDKGRV